MWLISWAARFTPGFGVEVVGPAGGDPDAPADVRVHVADGVAFLD